MVFDRFWITFYARREIVWENNAHGRKIKEK
jgi:hypothetical protein